jgi:uncharacterized protein YPO0396
MARRQLTAKEKEKMQAARVHARKAKSVAIEALTSNDQFVNPKFWSAVDPELFSEIRKAMAKAEESQKKAEIRALESRLAQLRGA